MRYGRPVVGVEGSRTAARIASTWSSLRASDGGSCHRGSRSGPPGQGTRPPSSVATMAIESVSQKAQVPPRSVTHRSSMASIRRAAPVMQAGERRKAVASRVLWGGHPIDEGFLATVDLDRGRLPLPRSRGLNSL